MRRDAVFALEGSAERKAFIGIRGSHEAGGDRNWARFLREGRGKEKKQTQKK
jgi:hypothetical protein